MADYTEEETKAVAEFKRHFREIKTARIGYAIRHEVDQYASKLFQKERQVEDQIHTKRLMSLPNGTRVLIRYGSMANRQGIIYGHGRQYLYVQLDGGEKYKFPGRYLTDEINSEREKSQAQVNQMFQPLARELNSYMAKEKGEGVQ